MREHEIQLIADLVAGRLQDEAEARAMLASSSELRAEYESQLAVFEALKAVGPASLTGAERAALHRDVWTELREAPATSRRTPWLYRLAAPVVGGMFIVVGLVAVLNQGSGADSIKEGLSDLTNADSAGGAVTTTAASATLDTASGESAGDGSASPSALLPSEPTAEDLARALSPTVESFYAAEAEKARSVETDETYGQFLDGSLIASFRECTEEAGLVEFSMIAARSETPGQEPEDGVAIPPGAVPYFAAIPSGSDVRAAPIVFLDLDTCDLVYIDE